MPEGRMRGGGLPARDAIEAIPSVQLRSPAPVTPSVGAVDVLVESVEGWRVRLLAGAILAGVLLFPLPASAANPVAGGRYVDHVRAKSGTMHLHLTVANDRREFVSPSWVEFNTDCLSGYVELASDDSYRLRSAQVRRNGGFGRDDVFVRVVGRFVRHGRVAVGSVVWQYGSCRGVRLRFHARLVGRPKATPPGAAAVCDRTFIGNRDLDPGRIYAAYDVHERGAGCTLARELARRWHAEERCHVAGADGCSIRGATCEGIRGGGMSPRALARCTPTRAPAAAVELVQLLPCWGSDSVELWLINLDCASARDVRVRRDGESCGRIGPRVACRRVGGYTCADRIRGHDSGYYSGRCVLDDDRFIAFEYAWDAS